MYYHYVHEEIRGNKKALENVSFRDSDYPEFYEEHEQNPHLDSLTISKQPLLTH